VLIFIFIGNNQLILRIFILILFIVGILLIGFIEIDVISMFHGDCLFKIVFIGFGVFRRVGFCIFIILLKVSCLDSLFRRYVWLWIIGVFTIVLGFNFIVDS
jgi:hypothetical protein